MKGLLRCPECTAAFNFIDRPGEHTRLTRELNDHRKETGHLASVKDMAQFVLEVAESLRASEEQKRS